MDEANEEELNGCFRCKTTEEIGQKNRRKRNGSRISYRYSLSGNLEPSFRGQNINFNIYDSVTLEHIIESIGNVVILETLKRIIHQMSHSDRTKEQPGDRKMY